MVEELRILDGHTLFDTDAHYVIPRYQRAYAWEDKEIGQLIDDINDIDIDSAENYYIGSLIVSKVQGKADTYEVVDGQQRLTTLFLLLQYLVSEGALEGELGKTLSFDCRPNSNYTLARIQKILDDKIDDESAVEQPIVNGIRAIRQKFEEKSGLNRADFVSRLAHVVLYRIEVPEHTDLNRYFEIMNTRGEQLEQHDILKAQLMGYLNDRGEQEFFSKIWNACSDMTGYQIRSEVVSVGSHKAFLMPVHLDPSTHTCVSHSTRSRFNSTSLPPHSAGISTSLAYHAAPI